MPITFNRSYFLLATVIFFVEVIIAVFVRDRFVRPYLGDVLVVILLYCFVRAFLAAPVQATVISVFGFAMAIEFLQAIQYVKRMGLEDSSLARTVLGTGFAWLDIVAYAVGSVMILVAENYFRKRRIAGRA
jgi:hypothetical protein